MRPDSMSAKSVRVSTSDASGSPSAPTTVSAPTMRATPARPATPPHRHSCWVGVRAGGDVSFRAETSRFADP